MIWLFFRGMFGRLFANPKILLAIVIVLSALFAVYKYHRLIADLEATKQEKIVLQANVDALAKANEENKVVIDQLTLDKENALKALDGLNKNIAATNKTLTGLQKKINDLKVPPTPLTPYLREAIDGIQKERSKKETR